MTRAYIIDHKKRATLFDKKRLHNSIVLACMSVRSYEGEANETAEKVCESVSKWLDGKSEVTSGDVRTIAGKYLKAYHPEASYIYINIEKVV